MTGRRWPHLMVLGLLGTAILAGCSAGSEPKGEAEGKLERVLESLPVLFPTVPIELGADGRVAKVAGFPSKTIDALAEDLTGNPLFGHHSHYQAMESPMHGYPTHRQREW